MKYGLKTLSGDVRPELLWKVFNYDQCQASFLNRLCPKLTEDHFILNTFSSMRVNLATQLISGSMARAIHTIKDMGYIKPEDQIDAFATANHCELMNGLFDCLNGNDINDTNPLRRGIQEGNDSYLYLQRSLDYIKQIEHRGSKNVNVYWISGYIITINSILTFCEANPEFLLFPRYADQDVIEQLYAKIRFLAGNSDNPYLIEFLRLLARVLSFNILCNIKNSNCEDHATNDITLFDFSSSNIAKQKYIFDDENDLEYVDICIDDFEVSLTKNYFLLSGCIECIRNFDLNLNDYVFDIN